MLNGTHTCTSIACMNSMEPRVSLHSPEYTTRRFGRACAVSTEFHADSVVFMGAPMRAAAANCQAKPAHTGEE